jgi:hypothetical protein
LEGICFDIETFLDQHGITEDVFMSNKQGAALTGDVLSAYLAGTLTIAELLERQPSAVMAIG